MVPICRLCQGSRMHHFSRRDAKNGEPMSLMLCQACSLVQVTQLPDAVELHRYYSHEYRENYKLVHTPATKHIVRAAQAAIQRWKWISPHLPAQKSMLVDVGAGGGEFVYLSQRQGCQSMGLEPHQGYSEFARQAYEVDVQTGGVDQLNEACADVITLFHVLEHLRDPLQVVQQLHRALRPDGLLAIEVPNILQADASPHNIFFSAHLYYYNALSLDLLLSTHFEKIWCQHDGNLCVIYRRRSEVKTITMPTPDAASKALNTFHSRGWWTYLTEGKGWSKPWRRYQQKRLEAQYKHLTPRNILDRIDHQLKRTDQPQLF